MAAAAGPQAAVALAPVSSQDETQGDTALEDQGPVPSSTPGGALASQTQQDEISPSQFSPDKPMTYADVVRAVHEAMTPIMQTHAATLQQVVQDLKGQYTQLAHTVTTNECRLGELFQDTSDLKQRYETLQKSYHQLTNKVDDLENRSRRCNLRVIGIPETVKGPDLFSFLQVTLPELLHVEDICANIVVERAHRLGPARPATDSRPRVVIFKTLNYVHKEAIWMASRKNKGLRWNDSRLLIFQDYSAEVTRARKEFSVLCSRLIKEGRKFALLFPARLRLFHGSTFKDFTTVEDAECFLKELQDEENGAASLQE